jgi:hypothetical protein
MQSKQNGDELFVYEKTATECVAVDITVRGLITTDAIHPHTHA